MHILKLLCFRHKKFSYVTESHSNSVKGKFLSSGGYGLAGILPKTEYILVKCKGPSGIKQEYLQKF